MNEKENYEKLIETLKKDCVLVPTFDENRPYYEVKVLIPRDIEDDVDSIEVDIRFKEKANCKKFTDREGIQYITGLKQEGSKQNVEQED